MKPFTLHVSQTFATQGLVTQASNGLHMTPVVGSSGLCWLIHASAAPSLAPLALSASLAAPLFSAASGGAPLASAHSTLSPSYLRDPHLAPHFCPLPDGPPLAFSPNYRTLSHYLLFCISLRFRLPLLSIVGTPLALPMVVGQPRALPLFLRPRLAHMLLCWPSCCYAFIRWPSGSFCGFGASSGVGLCVGLSR